MDYRYKGQVCTLAQPGLWCPQCDEEGILNPEHLRATRKALHDFHARVDGFLTSHEVKSIRKALKLTQQEAAAFFGGGPNAFSRYERGEVMQSRATDNLLRLLHRDPGQMKHLVKAPSERAKSPGDKRVRRSA